MIVHEKFAKPDDLFYIGKGTYLDRYSLEYVKEELLADELWYWYESAPYEGWGYALIRCGKLYDIHDMGHCSCFGEWDYLDFEGQPLEVLWKSLSKDMKSMTLELFRGAGLNE